MRRLLKLVVEFLGAWVSPWVAFGIVAVALIVVAPFWYEAMAQRRARNLVRQLVRADKDERPQRVEEIFRHCAGKPKRLRMAFDAARRYQQFDVRDRAEAELAALGPGGAAALARPKAKRKGELVTAFDFLLRAERLERDDLRPMARRTVRKGLELHPGDPELLALAERLKGVAEAPADPDDDPAP